MYIWILQNQLNRKYERLTFLLLANVKSEEYIGLFPMISQSHLDSLNGEFGHLLETTLSIESMTVLIKSLLKRDQKLNNNGKLKKHSFQLCTKEIIKLPNS